MKTIVNVCLAIGPLVVIVNRGAEGLALVGRDTSAGEILAKELSELEQKQDALSEQMKLNPNM